MPAIDKDEVIKVDAYNAVRLDEYNGTYQLQSIQSGQNDTYYLRWVFLSKWSKAEGGPVPDAKKMPMGVRLGDKAKAIEVLTEILEALTK